MTESAPTDDSGPRRAPSGQESSGSDPREPASSEAASPEGASSEAASSEAASPEAAKTEPVSSSEAVTHKVEPGTWIANNPEAFGEGAKPSPPTPAGPPPPAPGSWADTPAGLPPGAPGVEPGVPTAPQGAYPPPAYPPYQPAPYPSGPPLPGQGPYPVQNYPVQNPGRGRPTNAMAIVSLVLGILGLVLFFGIASVPAIITGHMARKQIREREEEGDGIALAGLILGWIGTVLVILFIGFFVVVIGFGVAASAGH